MKAAVRTLAMLAGDPEPVYHLDRHDKVRPALLLRLDPDTITVWPGDPRVLSAPEFLRLWGWRIMSDPAAGGILDLFAWGLVVEDGDLLAVRRPGGVIWEGRVPLPSPWLDPLAARPGRLVTTFAVPDSKAIGDEGITENRLRLPVSAGRLLGGRLQLRITPEAS